MSMRWLTILQFLEIFAAYGIVTLFLPWRILGKRFHRFSVAEQLIAYFFAGNFYIIYLVYLLQFLRISSRVTLLLGTAGPFLFIWIWKRKKQIPGAMESLLVRIERLLDGERGKKTSLAQLRRAVSERCFRGKRKQWLHALPEIAVLLAAIAAITYVYGPNMVEMFGYKASDIPVHNYWINELERNNIWVAGVYPYGFHIVIYYLHMVFGIPTYVLLRIFGVVQTYFVYLALVAALKMVCRGRFTPYFGILFYVMDIFNQSTYARFESALPQEFSMIFVLTSVCMAIRFFSGICKRTERKLPLVSGTVCDWIFADADRSFLRYDGCRPVLYWRCGWLLLSFFPVELFQKNPDYGNIKRPSLSPADGGGRCDGKGAAGIAVLGNERHYR